MLRAVLILLTVSACSIVSPRPSAPREPPEVVCPPRSSAIPAQLPLIRTPEHLKSHDKKTLSAAWAAESRADKCAAAVETLQEYIRSSGR